MREAPLPGPREWPQPHGGGIQSAYISEMSPMECFNIWGPFALALLCRCAHLVYVAYAIGVEQSLISKIELDRVKAPHTRLRLSEALSTWASI